MKTKRKPKSLRVSSGGRRLSGWRARVHEGVRNSVSALSCLLIAVQPVLAQNVVPTTNGPEVIEAPNGVGIVNIQTPNAQGLSQNSYDDFNVGSDGLILNNINGNFGQTQLGGVIAGNANLQDGSASIILNEVVGGNPSSLGGYLEVAGTRADVIVANPYGMTCDGCGFLNTDRLTLTTGTPIYDGSQFTGVSVDDGTIAVGEGGLDASDTTRFDLISRQITVAGSVQGQRIHVIAGRNDVIYATGEIREKADDGSTSPDLAIDSTVFGGMYAGAITITSTEDGVGVRAPTEMAASTGQMTLTADGRLVMGRASSEGAVSVTTTTGSVQVEQSLKSNDSLTITSAQDLIVDADAKIVAQAAAVFDIARDVNLGARAELVSADSISATMGRNMLMAQGAQVLSYGDIAVTAQEIEAGQDTQFMAGAAGGDGDTSTANLTLSAADRLTLWGGTAASGGSIDVVTRVLDIAAQGGLPAGSFVATTDARFALTRLEALDGVLQAGQMLSLENAGGILTVNGGILQSDDALLLSGQGLDFGATAQSLNGTVTAFATAGDLFVDGTLIGQQVDITASDSLNVSGTVEAAGIADLSAAMIENTGTLRATDLLLDAAQITNDGTAYAAQTLDIVASGAVTNSGNVVSDGWLRVAGGNPALVNAEGAEITAADDAVFTLARFDNAGAVASTDGRVLITSAGDVTNAQTAVIYGETLLQILSDGAILNDSGALLAQADMVIGGASGDVDARAASFTNQNGGLVETFAGDIQIAASVFENLRPDPLITDAVDTDEEESFSGDCSGLLGTYRCVTTTITTTVTTQIAEMVGEPGMILSGGDLTLAVDSARNAYSLISTAGNIELTAGTLENIGLDLTETTEVERSVVTRERFCFLFCGGTSTTTAVSNDAPIVEEAGAVFASIEAGGSIVGNVSGYLQNGAYDVGAIPTTSGVGAPGLLGTDPGSVDLTPLGSDISGITAGSIGNPALVVTNVDPDASYLVETRFEFIDLDQFLSSDYFLDALGYEPDEYTKRLGDAYVETQFLRAQLFALTGQRLTETGISERDQMQALYDNAIDASVDLDLALGVALTPEQIAALTQDIIWLEEITVDGQTVMAPRLYLADASSLARTGNAAGAEASSITAADLTLIAGTFTNSGAITGVDSVRLASLGDMDILGGRVVSGGMTQIDVAGTLTSLSGTIQGSDVSLAAQQIVLETARVTSGEGSNFTDGASRASTVLASGDVMIQAIEDINLTGAQVQAGGDTTLAAGGAITVGALELNRETDLTYDGGYSRSQGVTNVVSSIATDGNLTLYAAGQTDTGGNITLMGAQLQAGAGMVIQADQGDVLMLAVADSFYSDITGSSSGFFSESSSRDQVFSVANQVTSLDAGSIDVLAAGSILAEGTQFRTDGVTLTGEDALQNGDLRLTAATGDLMFTAPTDIYAESRVRERSFFGGLARLSSDIRTLETQALGSVAQVAGDIGLVTGGDLVLTAVDWAANGDIRTQVAGETLLLAAVDTSYRSASILNNNAILITTEDSEDYTESATFNRLDAGGVVDLDPTSPITLDAVRDPTIASMHAAGLLSDDSTGMTLAATYLGLTDPATGPPETLDETTDDWRDDLTMITATLPTGADGNGYLYLDEALERDSTIVNPIALVDEHFHEETTALNPAFKLLITIAVTQGIGGFGELAGGFGQAIGLTGEAAIGAANAAASNLAVGVIEAGVSGDFDIGELLEGAAFAGISAYASGAISLEGTFGVEFGEGAMAGLIRDGGQFTIASFSEGALDAAITSGLSSAVYGTDFGAGFVTAVTSSTVSLGLADIQSGIGDIFEDGANGGEGSLAHVTLHGLAGCLAAETQGADCAAGAAAAVASSLSGGNLDDTQWNEDDAELLGAFVGFLFSGGEAENVSIAAAIALSVDLNNRQLHTAEIQALEDYAQSLDGVDGKSAEEWLQELTLQAMRSVDDRAADQIADNPDAQAHLNVLIAEYGATFTNGLGGLMGFLNETNPELRGNTLANIDHVVANRSFYDTALQDWTPPIYEGLQGIVSATDLVLLNSVYFQPGSTVDQLMPAALNNLPEDARDAAATLQVMGLLREFADVHARLVTARDAAQATGDTDTIVALELAITRAENQVQDGAFLITQQLRTGMLRGATDEVVSGFASLLSLAADQASILVGVGEWTGATERNVDRVDAFVELLANFDELPSDIQQELASRAEDMNLAISEGRLEDAGEILGEFNVYAGSAVTGTVGLTAGTANLLRRIGGVNATNSETTTLYRAVGPDEYQDILDIEQFRPNPNGDGFQFGKQFGNDLDETIDFADQYPDIGGVVQVEVPNSFLDGIDVGPQVDTGVFPSGTVTIDIDDLGAFNGCISGVCDALD